MAFNRSIQTPAVNSLPGPEFQRAQLTSFARQTPINALVTIAVSLLTMAILWPVSPHLWLVLWAGLHLLLSLTVLIRWRRHRGQFAQSSRPISSQRLLRKGVWFALVSGLTWGSSIGFLPVIPATQQLAVMIVIASMAGGASTTLAAVPQAATVFILSSLLPFTAYFVIQAEPAYFGLAALAMVLTTAMLASTRIVYSALQEEMRTKQASAALLDQFYSERQEWLEISETTEAFALFDDQNQLLLWNEGYQHVLSLSPPSLCRGTPHLDILHQCANLISTEPNSQLFDTWLDSQLHLYEHPEVPLLQQLTDGRWLQSHAKRTDRGRLMTIHVDITDRKQAEDEREQLSAQLSQSQKMEALGTLAGGIAHEFNNVLSAILGFADLIRYQEHPTSRARQNAHEIISAGQRAKELVQHILTFSRSTNVEHSPQSLHLMVRDTLPLLNAFLPSTITIQHNCDTEVGTVLANSTQIHQVVMNLCANAESAMRPTGGVINIELDALDIDNRLTADHPHLLPGSYARLTVQDTGHGIAPTTMGRIFEPFFTTKEVGEGSGMGLATIHGIVRDHGGTITVESSPGEGATFRIYLPCIPDKPPVESPHQEPTPHGSGRILFVDDENDLVRLVQKMLTYLGYEVCAMNRSPEALAHFQAAPHDFDLVLTDQTMPEMTGEQLTRALRRIRPDIPIILYTGFSHVMDAAKAQAIGIDAFLLKPLVLHDLALAIRQVLHKRSG